MRTPAKKHTHILRTLFGFALSLLMLVPFAMIVLNSFKDGTGIAKTVEHY